MIGTDFYTLMPIQTAEHYAGLVDELGYVLSGKFDTAATPDTTTNTFQKGCLMVKTDALNGVAAVYQNTGTLVAPAWTLMDVAGAGGITALTGDVTASGNGSVAATIANSAVTTIKIADNAVTGAKIALASQVTGSVMYYNGTDWIQLAPGADGAVLTLAGGVPTWA